jgi:type IV secretory pathway VirD2 relaxase
MAYKLIMHHARASRRGTRSAAAGARTARSARPHFQRCAVRVIYTRNTTAGQWRAHGRYVEREGARLEGDHGPAGFNASGQGVEVAAQLAKWQAAGDERLWKLIISPEFGDRVDLLRLARDVLSRMERDLNSPLEWVAVTHHNTEHPHVHVALRGIRSDGHPLHLRRDYVKEGIRAIAENHCTQQLGYRTALDAAEAERHEVSEKRFTSIDRRIARSATGDDPVWFTVACNPARTRPGEPERMREQHAAARLAVLEDMGLAERVQPRIWSVRRDFETVLRAMQRANDHQRILAAHGVLLSDERLPIVVLDWRQMDAVEGRILVHGQEEYSGRNYLLLEGTDAKVHFVQYSPEMEQARHEGGLRTNSFVRLQRLFVDGQPLVEIEDRGDAYDVVFNRRLLAGTARQLIKRGVIPTEDGWGGWLGRYQAALRETATRLEQERERVEQARQLRQRKRDRSAGR